MATDPSQNNSTAHSQGVGSCSLAMEHCDEIKNHTAVIDKAKTPDAGGGQETCGATAMNTDSDCDRMEEAHCSTNDVSMRSEELVSFKVVFNKQKHDISFPLDDTIGSLKKHIETITGVPPTMQKVMFKGLCKDEKTLRESSFAKGVKVMVVGSTLSDILAVNTPSTDDSKEEKAAASQKEPLCQQKAHKKIIDKGVPEDVQPGIKNVKDSLPPYPISGMVNKSGGKVRLTFKLELDQVWIGTKERTDKVPMNSIKNVVSEPIEGHEEYHIMGIQLGTTEASRYWLYWVPAQYVDAIKDAILGKWQYF